MLLLGVVQAQAAGGVAAGSFDLLETQVLDSSESSVTFSSLSTYAADYQHLQIRTTLLQTGGGGSRLYMRMNGQTSYFTHFVLGTGSSVNSEGFSQNAIRIMNTISTTSNQFTAGVIDVLDPFLTTKNKTVRALQGTAGVVKAVALQSGLLANTAAVDSISFATGNVTFGDGGSLAIGSRFSLYGIKAV